MPVTAPTNANKRRVNPNGLQTGNQCSSANLPDVYTGSMDEMAPTANALKQKANDIVSLLRNKNMRDEESSKKMEIMKNSFPGFLYRGYYKNSIMIKYMKKRSKFLTSNNPIIIDISKSKGYTGRDDPPNNVINPDITLKFETATTKNYIFTVTAYFDSSYILTTNGAAGATDKIIEYCPTLEPIKNGL